MLLLYKEYRQAHDSYTHMHLTPDLQVSVDVRLAAQAAATEPTASTGSGGGIYGSLLALPQLDMLAHAASGRVRGQGCTIKARVICS